MYLSINAYISSLFILFILFKIFICFSLLQNIYLQKLYFLFYCFHLERVKHIKFPNPPFGIVSWFGNNLSYESKSKDAFSIVLVNSILPIFLAILAGILSSKNIQICAPFPERDFSTYIGISNSSHIFQNAATSFSKVFLSKSIAKKLHKSPGNNGYIPIVISPFKCFNIISSVNGVSSLKGH